MPRPPTEREPASRSIEADRVWRKWVVQRFRRGRQPCRAFLLWYRASMLFFRTELHPTRDEVPLPLNLKSFTGEMRVVFHGLGALMQHGIRLIPQEQLERHQFTEYLFQLIRDEVGWPLVHRPEVMGEDADEQLIHFLETVGQFRTLAYHMSQMQQLAYPAFVVFGRLYQQRMLETPIGHFIMRHPLLPEIDDIPHRVVRAICQQDVPPSLRSRVAWTLAKFYQWLRWLDLLPAVTNDIGQLLRTYMVFILLRNEFESLFRLWVGTQPHEDRARRWVETMESVEFSLRMEMKKVMHRELVGFPEILRAGALYTRMENSQGILRAALQSAIVSFVKVVRPEIDGRTLFPSYQTKLEQSLRLRDDLWLLKREVRSIWKHEAWDRWSELVLQIQRFRNTTMRFLMYRDWRQFDEFIDQMQHLTSAAARRTLLDQLNAFLGTLLREVNKRDVLQEHPAPYPLDDESL